MSYDLIAIIRDYATAKIDFDDHRLDESNDGTWQDRYRKLVAMEQMLIHVAKENP